MKDLQICKEIFQKELESKENVPRKRFGKKGIVFGNLEVIYKFHKQIFLKELNLCEGNVENVIHCFVKLENFDIYSIYSQNKPLSDTFAALNGGKYFEEIRQKHKIELELASYLITPVQRITRYPLLLQDLMTCCDEGQGGLKAALC